MDIFGRCLHCGSEMSTGGCCLCMSSRTTCGCGALLRCGCGLVFEHECPMVTTIGTSFFGSQFSSLTITSFEMLPAPA